MPVDRNDPEIIALIEEVTGAIKANETKLIGELRVARAKAKGADIDPVEHARLQEEVDTLTTSLETATKTSATELGKLQKTLAEKEGALSTHLIGGTISEMLAKGNFIPEAVDPITSMFSGKAAVVKTDKGYEVMLGDKTLRDALTEYAASDASKPFRRASAAEGGGAPGSGNKTTAVKEFTALNGVERTALFRTNRAAYDAGIAAEAAARK